MDRHGFQKLFNHQKPLIGMIHLQPCPGSPAYQGEMARVMDAALADAKAIEAGGMDGLIVENYGDVPFYPDRVPAETVAAMTSVIQVVEQGTKIPIGVNVLRNDALAALAIAEICGCAFIRINIHTGITVTDQGAIEGKAHETLRLRRHLGSKVKIFADIFVKHGKSIYPDSMKSAVRDSIDRGLSDILILTGSETGAAVDPACLEQIGPLLREKPILIGSGIGEENLAEYFSYADGFIIGTWIKRAGMIQNPVDRGRVERLVRWRDHLSAGLHPKRD